MRVSFIHRMSKKKKMSEEKKKDAVSSLFVCGKFSMLSLSRCMPREAPQTWYYLYVCKQKRSKQLNKG